MRKALRKRFGRHESNYSIRSSRSTSPLPPARETNGDSVLALSTKDSIWSLAHKKLRETQPELLTAFETILQDDCPIPPGASGQERMSIAVETKKSAMIEKQWMIKFMNQKIKVREQIHRIVKVVQTAQALGSAVAGLDPVHAGLPWAGVCVILTIILNDSKQNAAALDGLEEVNSLIARYAAIENLYLQRKDLTLKAEFRASLIALYTKVLEFQATAACHFDRNTLVRTIRSTFQLDDWSVLLQDISLKDAACQKMTLIFDSTDLRSGALKTQEILQEHDLNLQVIMNDLELSHEYSLKALEWFSKIRYGSDHDHIRHELGMRYQDSGQWLLQRVEKWVNSEKTPPFMWLCGTVGTGKSSLVSVVIEDFTPPINKSDSVIAYFYCSQKQYGRTDSTDILRCLISQLAWSKDGLSIAQPVKAIYDSRGRDRLSGGGEATLEECIDLITELVGSWSRAIIVIDALDECSNAPEVLIALRNIHKRSSTRLKIFVSSRMNIDVLHDLSDCEKVQVDEGINSGDIEAFVRSEVVNQQRRLLDGKRPDLESRLIRVLVTRAQGMFIWVKLQLLTFFSPKNRLRLSKDVEKTLDMLEKDTTLPELNTVYEEILEMNTRPGTYDRIYAMRTLQWILCSVENLPIQEVALAVSIDSNGRFDSEVDSALLLEICSNLIVLTEFNTCRFAHLSIRDFLLRPEGFRNAAGGLYTEAQINAEVAEICLSYIINKDPTFDDFNQAETSIGEDKSSDVNCVNLSQAMVGFNISNTRTSSPTQEAENVFDFSAATDPRRMPQKKSSSNVLPAQESSKSDSYESSFHSYAILHWAFHCGFAGNFRTSGSLAVPLEHFLMQYPPSSAFTSWNSTILRMTSFKRNSYIVSSNDVFEIRNGTIFGRIKGVAASPPCPAFVASAFGILEVLERMTGSEINGMRGMHGETCLHFAALGGQVDVVRLLLSKMEENIAFQDNHGETALYKAACFDYHAVIEILLEKMNDPEISQTDLKGKTALHEAAYFGSVVAARLLLSKMSKKDLMMQDYMGRTALHQAVNGQSEEIVLLLLDHMKYKDISLQDNYGQTALHMATSQSGEIVTNLLNYMTPEAIVLQNSSGQTALHKANQIQDEATLRLLLAKLRPKDLAIQDRQGNMVLHDAVSSKSTRFIISSLINGMDLVDLGIQNNKGETALHLAANVSDNGNLISLLLALMYSDDLGLKDNDSQTALHIAIYSRPDAAIMTTWLLKIKQENLAIQDHYGSTILHNAVSHYMGQKRPGDPFINSTSEDISSDLTSTGIRDPWEKLQFIQLVVDRMRPAHLALRDSNNHTAFEIGAGFDLEAEKKRFRRNS